MLRWTGIACALAACYHPAAELPCTTTCETAADCPNGQSCGADSRCFSDVQCFMMPDAGTDGATPVCLGSWVFRPCLDPHLMGTILMGTIDTTDDPRCIDMVQTTGSHLCAVVGSNVTVRDLIATGSRPLALVALVAVNIEGPLDASSHLANGSGPHAADVTCSGGGSGAGGTAGGGGGGGSFHGVGGDGGDGAAGMVIGGAAPDPVLPSALDEIRAGCAGTRGGAGGGAGGLGGGALAIVAGERITITTGGSIDASGAGPAGPPSKGGGPGGGAGGMVLLDAPSIVVGGRVFAFGASGASGGNLSTMGAAGVDPDLAKFAQPAAGGVGPVGAGNGGDGCGSPGFDGQRGTNAASSSGGGGGGGGAAGYIITSISVSPSMFAPPPLLPTQL